MLPTGIIDPGLFINELFDYYQAQIINNFRLAITISPLSRPMDRHASERKTAIMDTIHAHDHRERGADPLMAQSSGVSHAASGKVLIIEDEVKIANWLVTFLKQANFEVETAADGKTGLRLAATSQPDVILLDLMLPDMDGLDVCRALRQRSDVLILMLTARVEDTDRLVGLEMGADDYITKPFNPREVIARIRAFLRRANGLLGVEAKTLISGDLALNPASRLCTVRGAAVALTPTEFNILEALMRHPGLAFSREQLITAALDYDYAAYERTIDAHIRNIRRKIEIDAQKPEYIQTIFGIGYRFSDQSGRSE